MVSEGLLYTIILSRKLELRSKKGILIFEHREDIIFFALKTLSPFNYLEIRNIVRAQSFKFLKIKNVNPTDIRIFVGFVLYNSYS